MSKAVRRLFLDVDGPLIPFGIDPARHPGGIPGVSEAGPAANPLLARLDPEHGRRLSALPCDLVWATTWMADANTEVAPAARPARVAADGLAGS